MPLCLAGLARLRQEHQVRHCECVGVPEAGGHHVDGEAEEHHADGEVAGTRAPPRSHTRSSAQSRSYLKQTEIFLDLRFCVTNFSVNHQGLVLHFVGATKPQLQACRVGSMGLSGQAKSGGNVYDY